MCLNIIAVVGALFRRRSLGVNFQQRPVPCCGQLLGPPWDSWSLGVNSQQRSAVSNPLLGVEDEDKSEMIIYKEIAELCVELNLPPENFNIDHSDWGLREILSHLKKLKANKEAGQPSSQLSIPFIYKVHEELLAQKKTADKPNVIYIGPIHSNHELEEGQKKANERKNSVFSAISKISKRFK